MNHEKMIRKVLCVLGTASAYVVLSSGLAVMPAQTAEASPYWRCPTGWTYRANSAGTGAQCRRRTSDDVKPIYCPNVTFLGQSIGTFPQSRTGRDKCVGGVTVAGVANKTEHDPGPCPIGYQYRENHQRTADRCVKPGELQHRAPSAQFQSTP